MGKGEWALITSTPVFSDGRRPGVRRLGRGWLGFSPVPLAAPSAAPPRRALVFRRGAWVPNSRARLSFSFALSVQLLTASLPPTPPSSGKPSGLRAGRKLKIHRRNERWSSKPYNKSHSVSHMKANPLGGSCMSKGIVLEKIGLEAKQPNSAIRKGVRVQLIKNGKKIACFVPRDGCLNYVDENDEVLISGFGKRGKSKGDIPGCRFKVVKVSGVSLLALYKGKKEKPRS